MFRPAKMYHATSLIDENRLDDVIRALHGIGVCEITASRQQTCSVRPDLPDAAEISEARTRLSKAIKALDEYSEKPEPIGIVKRLLFPEEKEKFSAGLLSTKKILEDTKENLWEIEPLIAETTGRLKSAAEKLAKNKNEISSLGLLPEEETLLFRSTGSLAVECGVVSERSVAGIKKKLPDAVIAVNRKDDWPRVFIAVATLPEKAALASKILHEEGFSRIAVPEDGKPSAMIKSLREENENLAREIMHEEKEMKSLQLKYSKTLASLEESLGICKERIDAAKKTCVKDSYCIMEAWVPARDAGKFNEALKKNAGAYYVECEERGNAPVLLDNHPAFRPFEIILNLYSPPTYGELDPTPFIAFSFAIIFGFMLTDFAYGAMLFTAGIVINKGIGKTNPFAKKASILLLWLGASTMILGAIFGSYFGDILPKLGFPTPALLDSMKDAVIVIAISIGIGCIHLASGLAIGLLENVRKKDYLKAVSDQGVLLLFLAGALLFLTGISPLAGIILLAASLISHIVSKTMTQGPIVAAISLMGYSGFMGDVFSYARLTALAVGTSGIALAVNFMALTALKVIPVIGLPVAIIVFFVGHSFNLAMNSLGGFIHTLRLHFIEFFSKFYDGGGRNYKPFYAYRKIKPMDE